MFSCSTFTVIAADAGGTAKASRDKENAAISRSRVRTDPGNHLKETVARPFPWFSHQVSDPVRLFLILTGERQQLHHVATVGIAFAAAKRNPSQVEVLVVVVALGGLGIVLSLGWWYCP
jgi:hypothetical protein